MSIISLLHQIDFYTFIFSTMSMILMSHLQSDNSIVFFYFGKTYCAVNVETGGFFRNGRFLENLRDVESPGKLATTTKNLHLFG